MITWNVRGLGSWLKISKVRKLVRIYKAEMVFLQETKLGECIDRTIGRLWQKDGIDWGFSPSDGRSGGLIATCPQDAIRKSQ